MLEFGTKHMLGMIDKMKEKNNLSRKKRLTDKMHEYYETKVPQNIKIKELTNQEKEVIYNKIKEDRKKEILKKILAFLIAIILSAGLVFELMRILKPIFT